MDKYRAITEATVTRIRPVLLAAMTTALGVVPIIPDIFWKAMAVTIMGGLTFGSMLTLVMVPVFWVIFYQTKTPKTLPKAS
jgi:multidrug efflux pump subunit AcrB